MHRQNKKQAMVRLVAIVLVGLLLLSILGSLLVRG